MSTYTWWIDKPLIRGSGNPSDADLGLFRAQGFRVAVSLLEESKQAPCYDKESAALTGWSIYSIPIEEGHAPSLHQIRDFTSRVTGLPQGTKVLVFCESGLGRTAFMGAAYWVDRGLSSSDSISRISEACSATEWITPERQRVLDEYAQKGQKF